MSALNPTAAKLTRRHSPLFTSLNPHRLFFSKLSSSPLSLQFPPPPRPQFSLSYSSPVKASLQNPNHANPDKKPPTSCNCKVTDKKITDAVSLIPFLAPLRATAITATTAVALIFSGFWFALKPSVAAPLSPPPNAEPAAKDPVFLDKRVIELKDLLESDLESNKIPEAIEIVEKLMVLQPDEVEWPLMRALMCAYSGEVEMAKNGYDELLKKAPCCVEAYDGLVFIAADEEDGCNEELENIERRIKEAMKLCERENNNDKMRNFRLLVAEIKMLKD